MTILTNNLNLSNYNLNTSYIPEDIYDLPVPTDTNETAPAPQPQQYGDEVLVTLSDEAIAAQAETEAFAYWEDLELESQMNGLIDEFNSYFTTNSPMESDYAILNNQLDTLTFEYAAENKPKNPPPKETETVIITGTRTPPRSGSINLAGLSGGAPKNAGNLFQPVLDQIKSNIKAIFPSITDEEIDKLLSQLKNSGKSVSFVIANQAKMKIVNGKQVAIFSASSARNWQNALRQLGTPEGNKALDLFDKGIKNRTIIISHPKNGGY